MGLDISKTPFLYSIGTEMAYRIARDYYNNIHYVWCATEFNSLVQPPTSNPATICKRYIEQIKTGDRHAYEIAMNIVGILKGAQKKRSCRVITKIQHNKIKNIIAGSKYVAYFPVIYIIDSRKVKDRCIEVKKAEKASDEAVEYRIEDLTADEFEIIFLRDVFNGLVSMSDKEVEVEKWLKSKQKF